MRVDIDLQKLTPWLEKKNVAAFNICFAFPPSKSKKKIMIRLDKTRFFTLSEIERELGESIFIILE